MNNIASLKSGRNKKRDQDPVVRKPININRVFHLTP